MATYKGFPKEWPPIKVNPFEDFEVAYRNVRDSFSSVNDLRRILTQVFENIAFANVKKDFGVVGDGTTNDASRLQEAFDAESVIILPEGDYFTGTTALDLNSDNILIGAGRGKTSITYTGTASAVKMATAGTTITNNLQIRDLKIIADSAAIGLDLTNVGESNFINIEVSAVASSAIGIDLDSSTLGGFRNQFTDVIVLGGTGGTTGVRFTGIHATGQANENSFFGGRIDKFGTSVDIVEGTVNKFFGTEFSDYQTRALRIDDDNNSFFGCRYESAAASLGILFDTDARRSVIIGGNLSSQGGTHYTDNGTDNIVLESGTNIQLAQNSNGTLTIVQGQSRIDIERAATGPTFRSKIIADSGARWQARGDGRLEWGTGGGTIDTNLYRVSANVLKSDDKVVATAGLGAGNSVANVNTPSGATAKALEIFDAAGVSLGFIPIYGSQW